MQGEWMSQQELLKMLGDWQSRHSDVESAVVKRRRAKRMKARWKLRTATVNRYTQIPPHFDIGWVIDISATGLGMFTQQPPATGDWCWSFIYLPEQSTPCIVVGRVAWAKPLSRGFVSGIEFVAWYDDQELDAVLEVAESWQQE